MAKDRQSIKSFGDVSKKMNLTNRAYRGIHPIPVNKIVGSVGRVQDLLPGFKLRQPDARYYRIRKVMEKGEILPPIIVYQTGDEYYVLDGNHRVAVSRELGTEFIDAEVIEFFPSDRRESRTLKKKRAEFEEVTGLQGIDVSEPRHYDTFFNYIQDYAKRMELFLGREAQIKEAALNWFLSVFTPAVQAIVERGLEDVYQGKTLGDIFCYILDYKWYRGQKEGYDIGFEPAMDGFIKEILGKQEPLEEKKSFMKKVGGLLEEVLPWLKRE
ncbi:MAG: DUF4032 domain-containing protein [Candidatus Atribacteria bacterium]|nr:DUF4032 domain-containing protein [Candidatus Atribacteria bacterium]